MNRMKKTTEMIQKYAATLKDRHLYFKKCKFSYEIWKKCLIRTSKNWKLPASHPSAQSIRLQNEDRCDMRCIFLYVCFSEKVNAIGK
jgi:hypothetical protein